MLPLITRHYIKLAKHHLFKSEQWLSLVNWWNVGNAGIMLSSSSTWSYNIWIFSSSSNNYLSFNFFICYANLVIINHFQQLNLVHDCTSDLIMRLHCFNQLFFQVNTKLLNHLGNQNHIWHSITIKPVGLVHVILPNINSIYLYPIHDVVHRIRYSSVRTTWLYPHGVNCCTTRNAMKSFHNTMRIS